MNRAFISLYLVIVFSVILVGWGTDKLWQVYNPEPEVGQFESLFFNFIEKRFVGLDDQAASELALQLSQETDQNIQIYSLEDLAQSSLGEKISQGEIVTVFDEQGRKSSYKRIEDTSRILRIDLKQRNAEQGKVYIILLVAFYVIIALVIYIWIWPLSRDLRRLQLQTKIVGVSGAPGKIDLGQGSAVYSLAAAFNSMAERIHELVASHKEMTYAVSHELRTPLARMKFALEMARAAADAKTTEKQLASVSQDVAEMDKLINELLAYAGFEQHSQRLDLQKGDLLALVESLISAHCETNKKTLHYAIKNHLPSGPIKAEWYLLERSIHNILQNAAKFAKQNILVELSTENGHCIVAVSDDGPGIAQEDREKVFQAFVRLRNEGDDNRSGFGLGLAIVYRIMKWHGGGVKIENASLGGAKFILHWPLLG